MQKHQNTSRNILIAFLLNLSFSLYEFIGGGFTGSVAIMSDAVHDMGDAISIGISFVLEHLSKKRPNSKYTYGYVRYSLIGGLVTTVVLLVGSILIIVSAVPRLFAPSEINYDAMVWLSVVGVVVNFAAAYLTSRGKSLNQKSVNLHMLEDTLGWVVVLVGAIIMRFTHFSLIDPILSIGVAIFIFTQAIKNCISIFDVFLEKTPHGVSLSDLKKDIKAVAGVENVHHLHVWSLDGYHNYATLHLVCSADHTATKHLVKDALKAHGIAHVTIETESASEDCGDAECEAVPMPADAHGHNHGHSH